MATFDFGGLLGSNMFGGGDMGLEEYLTPEQRSRMNQQGIMALAASLLKSSGPSAVPIGIGQALGEAYGAGQTGYQQAQQGAIANIATRQKLDEYRRGVERRDQLAKIMSSTGGEMPVAGMPITADQALAMPNMPPGPTVARASMIGQVPAAGAVKQSPNDLLFNKYMNAAQLLSLEDPVKAKAYQDLAFQIKPTEEFSTTPQFGVSAAGTPISFVLNKSGGMKLLDVQRNPEYNYQDAGGYISVRDKTTNREIERISKTLAPQVIGGAETGYFQVGGGGGRAAPAAPRAPSAAAPAALGAAETPRYVPSRDAPAPVAATTPRVATATGLTPLIAGTGATAAGKVFSNEGDLRKEYTAQMKPFIELGQAFRKVEAAALNPSAAGDISMIYGYMKILDPGSTVMQGEQATAANAGGVPDRVKAMYNQALNGERLADPVRQDFYSQARNLIESQRELQQDIAARYSAIATQNKLNPNQVVFDPFQRIKTPQQIAADAAEEKKKKPASYKNTYNLLPRNP